MESVLCESGILSVPVIIFFFYSPHNILISSESKHVYENIMLILSGPYTGIALVLYTSSIRNIPLNIVAMLQLISPLVILFIGCCLYNEPIKNNLVSIVFILSGLFIYLISLCLSPLKNVSNKQLIR